MGALHGGHASLLRKARAETGYVLVTIFVNPTQFGPREDLSRYPRPFERDRLICEGEGADLLFAPTPEAVYPPGFSTFVEVQGIQDVLEGASRPGHFRGVCTVVLKLLLMTGPDVAFFGQKDAQQVVTLKQMVADLNVPVKIQVCPTVREPDGLALSSRNQYLSPGERQVARCLSQALRLGLESVVAGERDGAAIRALLEAVIAGPPGAALDYAAVVDAETLQPLDRLDGKVLLAVAVKVGRTRLIDNQLIQVTGGDAHATDV
jgi:pantoate--beta-alanine ligase